MTVRKEGAANTDAELDRLQQLAEQLSGFDERVSLEGPDGAMTALAATTTRGIDHRVH